MLRHTTRRPNPSSTATPRARRAPRVSRGRSTCPACIERPLSFCVASMSVSCRFVSVFLAHPLPRLFSNYPQNNVLCLNTPAQPCPNHFSAGASRPPIRPTPARRHLTMTSPGSSACRSIATAPVPKRWTTTTRSSAITTTMPGMTMATMMTDPNGRSPRRRDDASLAPARLRRPSLFAVD